MLANLLDPDLVEEIAEARLFFFHAPLEGSNVCSERVGDGADARPPGREQQTDCLFNLSDTVRTPAPIVAVTSVRA
jgi:hypothetical protein